MRVRSPSTTLTLTETVSPGSNGGMVLPSLVICSCSSCLIRFMANSVGCARNAEAQFGVSSSSGEVTVRRSFYDKERALSPFRARPFRPFRARAAGACHIGGPEVRAAFPGEALGLALAPGRHLGVVAAA